MSSGQDLGGDMSTNGTPTLDERDRNKSAIELDRRILDDNVAAAINASERLHMLAKKKLWEQGLAPAAGGAEVFTDEVLGALAKGLWNFLGPLLGDLKKRIVELEATALSDGGVWKPEKVFTPNQITTYRGAAWVCQEANSNVRPGTSSAWRLMHKTIDGR